MSKAELPIIPTTWSSAQRVGYPADFPSAEELAHLRGVCEEVETYVARRSGFDAVFGILVKQSARRTRWRRRRAGTLAVREIVEEVAREEKAERGRRALAVYLQPNGKLRGWPGAASLQVRSVNRKITAVDVVELKATGLFRLRVSPRPPFTCTTYASIEATCPSSCSFRGAGCYAETGYTRFAGARLDSAAKGLAGDEVIREEATAIRAAFGGRQIPQDGARGGRDLRLHIAGDVSSLAGAQLLGEAAADWRRRGGGSVWTFTHRWQDIPRASWGAAISVLASVEHPQQFSAARAQGYAPAIVVPNFSTHRATKVSGLKVIPCPAETNKTTCSSCRLCLDRDLVKMNAAIAFAVHGVGANIAAQKLVQLRGGPIDV